MKIVVTGGAGFIGSNFIKTLLDKLPDVELVVFDKFTYAANPAYLEPYKGKIQIIHGDICNPEDLAKIGKCDVIFNFAAETHVDRSIENSFEFVNTDVIGTAKLLDYSRKIDLEKFIQISTDEVYGSIQSGSFSEDAKFNPSSPYSASKAGAEMLVSAYSKTYGLPVNITRSSNNFGPHQYPEKLIPLTILRALNNEKIPVYGTGTNIRDWIYVEDNCSGIFTVFKEGKIGEAYNIGGECEKTNIEIVKTILRLLNKSENLIQYVGDRPGHDFRYSIDNKKIKDLGWHISNSFDESMTRTINWYIAHCNLWH